MPYGARQACCRQHGEVVRIFMRTAHDSLSTTRVAIATGCQPGQLRSHGIEVPGTLRAGPRVPGIPGRWRPVRPLGGWGALPPPGAKSHLV